MFKFCGYTFKKVCNLTCIPGSGVRYWQKNIKYFLGFVDNDDYILLSVFFFSGTLTGLGLTSKSFSYSSYFMQWSVPSCDRNELFHLGVIFATCHMLAWLDNLHQLGLIQMNDEYISACNINTRPRIDKNWGFKYTNEGQMLVILKP